VTRRHTSPYLVGRAREFADLEDCLLQVGEGAPVTVVVEGPAGIGKTSLLRCFADRHAKELVLQAAGASWESSYAYGIVEQLLAGTAIEPPPTSATPVAAAQQLLGAAAGARTMLVLVDDAHWADAESLRALSSALRRTTRERILLVLVRQVDAPGADPEVQRLIGDMGGRPLRLSPLSAADIKRLATESRVPLRSPAAQQLCAHTQGIPLHILQLLRELPPETWSEWQPSLPPPSAVAVDIAHRLASCTEQTRSLVEAVAVLGEHCSFEDAALLAASDDPVAALDEAQRQGLLLTGERRGLTVLRLPSPMAQAAVRDALGPMRRRDLHRRAAGIVEDERAVLAHRVHATPFPDARLADELDEFADRQVATGAWGTVGDALVKASRLTPEKSRREERLLRAVDAVLGAGNLPEAIAFVPEIESFRESELRNIVLAYLAILRGRAAEAETALTRAWELCDPERDPETAAVICQRRVLHALCKWRGADLVEWADRAMSLAHPMSPAAVESAAIRGLGLGAMGRVAEARAHYAALTEKVRRGAQAQRVRMGKGWLDLALDDPDTARGELESAVPTVFLLGSTRISLWAQAWLARAQFVQGDWEAALDTVHRAAVQVEAGEWDLVRPLVHWTGAQIQALRGNWTAADEHLRLGGASPHDYEIMFVPATMARAHCAEAKADYGGVLRALVPVAHLGSRGSLDEPGFWPWPDIYANALVMTNQPDAADAFLAPFEAVAAKRGHKSAMARLGYVRGRIHGARGDIDAARDSFEVALEKLTGLPLPYDRARVNFAYGQTLRRAGKRREADAVLQTAREAYVALGATTYVERCDRELKAGGLNIKRARNAIDELTPQERAVAELVARGMTNKEAAGELFVSVKTVQFHLTRIYTKLGIRTRGELAAQYRQSTNAEEP
jgi:DNA-binding CsgD family transcriptional regulator/Arc/MetJ-type ribon-helix-helix transcriptional regulator